MSIDAVVIAGDPVRADLKRFAWVNVKDNIYKRAGIVGFIIPVVLLAVNFQSIFSYRQRLRNSDRRLSALAVLCDTSVIQVLSLRIGNYN